MLYEVITAKAIHGESKRKDNSFVVVNCGGIPETLMESELFGHKKGSFTGATHDKKGLFEAADKGTIFLDEIGELTLPIQVKLLRAVQERVFKPVGSNEDVSVDIRIVITSYSIHYTKLYETLWSILSAQRFALIIWRLIASFLRRSLLEEVLSTVNMEPFRFLLSYNFV